MDKILTKLGIAFGTSVTIAESVNLTPLWNALVTLAVTIITILTVEGASWLRAYFKKKKAQEEKDTPTPPNSDEKE